MTLKTAWFGWPVWLLLEGMTETEQSVLEALRELERTAQQIKEKAGAPNIRVTLQRLDELTLQLPKGTDPELLHFLHKKSYEKARQHLEGKAQERGTCGS